VLGEPGVSAVPEGGGGDGLFVSADLRVGDAGAAIKPSPAQRVEAVDIADAVDDLPIGSPF
jgi:hypothetical protein